MSLTVLQVFYGRSRTYMVEPFGEKFRPIFIATQVPRFGFALHSERVHGDLRILCNDSVSLMRLLAISISLIGPHVANIEPIDRSTTSLFLLCLTVLSMCLAAREIGNLYLPRQRAISFATLENIYMSHL